MKIYFARYGEKEENGDGFELSEHGERQVQMLARRLKQERINISKIYTAPYNHLEETSEILSKTLYVPVFRDDRIKEIGDSIFHREISEDEFLNLETLKLFVNELIRRNSDVLLVLPHCVIRIIMSYLIGLPLQTMNYFNFDFGGFSMSECSLSGGHLVCNMRFFNDTTHLRVP